MHYWAANALHGIFLPHRPDLCQVETELLQTAERGRGEIVDVVVVKILIEL